MLNPERIFHSMYINILNNSMSLNSVYESLRSVVILLCSASTETPVISNYVLTTNTVSASSNHQ
jgi:hypothetical protein